MMARLILADGTEFTGHVSCGERQWQGGFGDKRSKHYKDMSNDNHKVFLMFEVNRTTKGGEENG